MTDSTNTATPDQSLFAPASNYWDSPSNWAKPVSGNEFTQGTQALNSVGSINSENPAATGFTASQQGITGGGFNAASSIPSTQAGAAAASTASTTGNQNSGVGNTAANTSQVAQNTANQTLNTEAALNKSTQSGQTAAQSSTGSGISGLGGQAASFIGNQLGLSGQGGLGSQIAQGVNNLGNSLFGTGTASQLNATNLSTQTNSFFGNLGIGSQDSLLSSYGVAPGASTEAAANAADATGSFAGAASAASLMDYLGSAGIGYTTGGFIANAEGGNPTGGSIGGAIGATAGTYVLPGIGTVVGDIIGSTIGGLFGNSSPGTQVSAFTSAIGADGTITTPATSFKGQSTAEGNAIEGSLSSVFSGASKALGINFPGDVNNPNSTGAVVAEGGTNTLHSGGGPGNPGFINLSMNGGAIDSGNITFNPSDPSSVSTAFYQALTDAAGYAGYTDTSALYNWFYGQPTNEGNNPGQIPLVGGSTTGPISPLGNSTTTGVMNV